MSLGRRERIAGYRSAQRRFRPDRRQFERLVGAAVAELPEQFRRRIENVAIVVEEWPPRTLDGERSGDEGPLLGLYRGTPLEQRSSWYHLTPPDRITLYRGPILARCRARTEVIREIRDTVLHEIGHYFGLGDDELP